MDALIGFNGFVGSTLLSQLPNEPEKYNSSNLEDIEFKTFDNLYICCPTGSKYYVNEHSYQDYMNMRDILRLLATVNCNDCYLVSSQDCNSTLYSDETFICYPFTEYGKNRLFFEDAIRDLFENHHVMRIGCLFGKGLKKNIIFDLLNHNYLENIKSDFAYQLYNMDYLYKDMQIMKQLDIHLWNRFSEPVYISEIIKLFNECGYDYHFDLPLDDDLSYRNKGSLIKKSAIMSELKDFILNYEHNSDDRHQRANGEQFDLNFTDPKSRGVNRYLRMQQTNVS